MKRNMRFTGIVITVGWFFGFIAEIALNLEQLQVTHLIGLLSDVSDLCMIIINIFIEHTLLVPTIGILLILLTTTKKKKNK